MGAHAEEVSARRDEGRLSWRFVWNLQRFETRLAGEVTVSVLNGEDKVKRGRPTRHTSRRKAVILASGFAVEDLALDR